VHKHAKTQSQLIMVLALLMLVQMLIFAGH
jgi:hypothetical protein